MGLSLEDITFCLTFSAPHVCRGDCDLHLSTGRDLREVGGGRASESWLSRAPSVRFIAMVGQTNGGMGHHQWRRRLATG